MDDLQQLDEALVDSRVYKDRYAQANGDHDTEEQSISKGSEVQPWPEPEKLPTDLPPVPEMQRKMLPLPLCSWLTDIAERIQCSLSFPSIGAIIAIATLVGRRVGIRPKRHDDWLVVPNLWGGVVGRPGILKTPALAEVMKPLHRLELQALVEYEEALKSLEFSKLVQKAKKEELERKIRDAVKKGDAPEGLLTSTPLSEEEPVPVRYVVNDSTVEKLGVILSYNPRGVLIFRDELVGFLRTLNKDGHEGDRAFYLEAWTGSGSYTYDRIGRGTLHIKSACVSILGGIQPGPLADYLRATVRGGSDDDGLMQRFQLLVYPDDPQGWKNVDRWPDTDAKNRVFELFEKLRTLNPLNTGACLDKGEEIPFFRFTLDAQGFFNEWRAELEDKIRARDQHPALEAHLAKYRSLMPSLALLFHLLEILDGKAEGAVSTQAAKRAAAWCDFLEAHARKIYHVVTQQALFAARLLAKRLHGDLPNPFTARDVYRKEWSGLTDPAAVRAATGVLEDLHWLQSEKISTTGRTKLQFHINPHL